MKDLKYVKYVANPTCSMLLVALALFGTAFAQAKDVTPQAKCHCIVPAGSTGQVLSSSGDVQVSGTHGFFPAVPGTALSQGSHIIVGSRSDAHIVFGDCHLNILPLRDVSLDPADGGICVRTTLVDGLAAGFDPAGVTLGTRSGTFQQAAGAAAPAAGTTATADDEAADEVPMAGIIAAVVAVGGIVAIAASASDNDGPDPDPVSP